MEYHLRVSSTRENGLLVLREFQSSFKISAIVSAYEHLGINEDGAIINPHCHSYIKYDVVPKKQAVSAFFKKWKHLIIKPATETAGYSHKVQRETTERNISYIIGDGDIIINTLGDLSLYKEKTEIINLSKKTPSRDKIYNMWILKNGLRYPKSKFEMFLFIDNIYIFEWKKTPLAIGHKTSYSTYLLALIHQNIKEKKDEIFEILMQNIYGIRDHKELVHDIDKEEARIYNTKSLNDYNCDFIDEENDISFE